LYLFLFLKVAFSAAVQQTPSRESLELKSTNPQNSKHDELRNYLMEQNLVELFVRNLHINGVNHGPVYFHLNPENHNGFVFGSKIYKVNSLDFGTVSKYSGLQPGLNDVVWRMKRDLVKENIFLWSEVLVGNVFVNGIDYGWFGFGSDLE
jgi:hypothetical protein